MGEPNPYLVLDVKQSASADELKHAYRRQAQLWHPDRNSSAVAAERFRVVQRAYDLLSDPVKRAELDRQLDQAASRPILEPLMTSVYTRSGRVEPTREQARTFDMHA